MIYPCISGIDYESIADGPGIRATMFLSGCNHNCPGCHNPQTHNPEYGTRINESIINNIAQHIRSRFYISGITLSGGDPLYNISETTNFIYSLRNRLGDQWSQYTLWLYTGYTWEQLMKIYGENEDLQKLLLITDVVVDGPYIEKLADASLAFRGSSNQRIIDVNQSLKTNEVVLWNHST